MNAEIKQLEFFRDLPDEIITALEKNLQVKSYSKDAPILWAGMECTAVYFILEGRVDISRLSVQGREQVLERLEAGEAFNLVPIFLGKPLNPADARAIGPSELLVIGREDFLRLLDRYPALMRSLAAYLAKRLLSMVGLAERLALFPVRQRLAAFLINQADMVGGGRCPPLDPGGHCPSAGNRAGCGWARLAQVRAGRVDPLPARADPTIGSREITVFGRRPRMRLKS